MIRKIKSHFPKGSFEIPFCVEILISINTVSCYFLQWPLCMDGS